MAQVVLSDTAVDANLEPGTLFKGLKFWLSHKVPQRSRFINDVRANGGEILPIEKHADIKIVDHVRKETLPGTHSYTFIESSVRNGVLEDLEDHRAGPPEGTVRSVGSIIQPAKGTRNKYTQEDDRILWNWVHENPQKGGGTDGNEIYKQLEAQHPQHPWQSWRDRWIKQLKGKSRPFPLPHNAPPTPPLELLPVIDASAATKGTTRFQAKSGVTEDDFASFSEDDAEALMKNGADILDIHPDNVVEAWDSWVRVQDDRHVHTAQDWQRFWEKLVRPRYLKRLAKRTELNATEKTRLSTSMRSGIASNNSLSPSTKVYSSASIKPNSPHYRSESASVRPRDQPRGPKHSSPDGVANKSHNSRQHTQAVEEVDFAREERMKRKRTVLEEEVPSSSPLATMRSPKRTGRNASDPLREIASTPDTTPVRSGYRPDSPLIIGSEDDLSEEESDLDDDISIKESPLGKQPSITLSEPAHVSADTQGLFKDETQQVDLKVPSADEESNDGDSFLRDQTQAIDLEVLPPDEGWDDEDPGAEASSGSDSTFPEVSGIRPIRQGTQGILRGQTLDPDFDVAEPEGGWDQMIPSSPPAIPSSPPAESEASDVDAQTEAWINSHAVDGISVDDVLRALKCTSMDTYIAETVLNSMRKDGDIPENKRGVWTEVDDEDLGSTDARKIQRLESKHGKDCLTSRWEFLSFYGKA